LSKKHESFLNCVDEARVVPMFTSVPPGLKYRLNKPLVYRVLQVFVCAFLSLVLDSGAEPAIEGGSGSCNPFGEGCSDEHHGE
jgi:hypothetical protein